MAHLAPQLAALDAGGRREPIGIDAVGHVLDSIGRDAGLDRRAGVSAGLTPRYLDADRNAHHASAPLRLDRPGLIGAHRVQAEHDRAAQTASPSRSRRRSSSRRRGRESHRTSAPDRHSSRSMTAAARSFEVRLVTRR